MLHGRQHSLLPACRSSVLCLARGRRHPVLLPSVHSPGSNTLCHSTVVPEAPSAATPMNASIQRCPPLKAFWSLANTLHQASLSPAPSASAYERPPRIQGGLPPFLQPFLYGVTSWPHHLLDVGTCVSKEGPFIWAHCSSRGPLATKAYC